MSKIITVFGATGNQGGSVVAHILADPVLSKEFKIRGITRDTAKPAAQALAAKGVEVVSADLNSKESLTTALSGTHTLFLVTNYWELPSPTIELTQGKNVTDVALSLNVSHIIFSSLLHVSNLTQGRLSHVPHFDGKADIEEYIRDSGLPATFFLPGYFMSNLETMVRPGEDGVLTWSLPVSEDAKFPLIDINSDTGVFVAAILRNPANVLGKRILGAAEYRTAPEIVDAISKGTGKEVKYVQVSEEVYKGFLPEAVAQEFLENHLFVEEPGYFAGEELEKSHGLLGEGLKLVTFEEFVEGRKGSW